LLDVDGNVLSVSDNIQDGTGLPMEEIGFFNPTGGPALAFVAVKLFSGSAKRFDIFYSPSGGVVLEFASAVSSIPGHANAKGAISVPTVNADAPGVVANYSSNGPCNIVFPVVETRAKPDITGVDGVAVTGAAGFQNPFFGTSAAAPHIAALAALV